MHVPLILVVADMACKVKYQTSIARAIWGKKSIAMTWCDMKLGGGYNKGVWVMEFCKKA